MGADTRRPITPRPERNNDPPNSSLSRKRRDGQTSRAHPGRAADCAWIWHFGHVARRCWDLALQAIHAKSLCSADVSRSYLRATFCSDRRARRHWTGQCVDGPGIDAALRSAPNSRIGFHVCGPRSRSTNGGHNSRCCRHRCHMGLGPRSNAHYQQAPQRSRSSRRAFVFFRALDQGFASDARDLGVGIDVAEHRHPRHFAIHDTHGCRHLFRGRQNNGSDHVCSLCRRQRCGQSICRFECARRQREPARFRQGRRQLDVLAVACWCDYYFSSRQAALMALWSPI